MTTSHDDGGYLWDRSGEPDPIVTRLETVLASQRHRDRGLDWSRLSSGPIDLKPVTHPAGATGSSSSRPPRGQALRGLAAAVVLMVIGAWLGRGISGGSWKLESLEGSVASGSLPVGRWLETDAASRVRLEVGSHGHVTVEPGSRLRIAQSADDRKVLELARGQIDAFILAPPRLFLVDTPTARAVDLGCAYTLEVDRHGASVLFVRLGHVALEGAGLESIVPRGATCVTIPGHGPGVPAFTDASPEFLESLGRINGGKGRPGDLANVLVESRPRDTVTLWHLLSRTTGADRAAVYDRMATLCPPPAGVTRAAALALDKAALTQWWDSLAY